MTAGSASVTIPDTYAWPILVYASASGSSTNTISLMAGNTTCASSASSRSIQCDATRCALAAVAQCRQRTVGGPWAFLELRQRYSIIGIADQLMELVERRLVMGGEAFVHDHYEDVLRLLRWMEIDRFDRRAVNLRLADGVAVPVGSRG